MKMWTYFCRTMHWKHIYWNPSMKIRVEKSRNYLKGSHFHYNFVIDFDKIWFARGVTVVLMIFFKKHTACLRNPIKKYVLLLYKKKSMAIACHQWTCFIYFLSNPSPFSTSLPPYPFPSPFFSSRYLSLRSHCSW